MKNIISKYINISKPQRKLVEAEVQNDDIQLYMNTWKNYNEYGADLEAYGIKDGWMSLEDAEEFCKKYAEDEPFINDYENSPIELSEYDNAPQMIEKLKEYEACDEKQIVKAILEAGSITDISEAIEVVNSGDYIWFEGVSTDEELAHAYIDMFGGITAAVSEDRLESYFDEDAYKEYIEDDVREMVRENEGYESIDDVTDEELESYLDSIVANDIATAKADHNDDFFEDHFDYEAFGRDLGFDYTFVTDGAICVL